MKPFRRLLLRWYDRAARPLPWRTTRDPYRIWVSEIMLQQTRVAAVLPYYERFLARFPDAASLAAAPESELLALWSGLGYYSRARNMQSAARKIVELSSFPRDYDQIRRLPGVGDYTAAAIASIAFGLPYAVLDGNVLRVLSRLTNDAGDIASTAVRRRLHEKAQALLEPGRPGEFNQALMELGAIICLPRAPQCLLCPIAELCEARRLGVESQLPVKLGRVRQVRVHKTLLLAERNGRVLLWQRSGGGRMNGFWELPEAGQLPEARHLETLHEFRHSITNHSYVFTVVSVRVRGNPEGFSWIKRALLNEIPLSTTARKALARSEV